MLVVCLSLYALCEWHGILPLMAHIGDVSDAGRSPRFHPSPARHHAFHAAEYIGSSPRRNTPSPNFRDES